MVALDDPRWAELEGAYGSAAAIPELLRALEASPDPERWSELYSWLCHQDTNYTATYAAVPHIVEMAVRRPPTERTDFVVFIGHVAACERTCPVPDELAAAYERALAVVEPHVRVAIAARPADETIWYLLSAAAAVRGLGLVATALEDFVAGVANAACPSCDADVEIAWQDAEPPAAPIEPLDPEPSDWTEDDATARLLALAELADRPDVAEVLQAWEGTVACPECDERFRVRPAHLAYYRSWVAE